MKYLTPATVAKIEDFFDDYPLRKYNKGQILVLPGEMPEHAYLLIEGRLKLYDTSYRGDPIIIDMIKSPAFFPLSLIMNSSSSFLIHEADTDIVVRQAPVDATLEFLNSHPAVVMNLLSVVYKKFDDALKRMARLMDGSARLRLVSEILVTCEQIGDQLPHGGCVVRINQSTLASRIGLTRETINRELKSLKERRLISVSRSHVVVPSVAALEAYLQAHK